MRCFILKKSINHYLNFLQKNIMSISIELQNNPTTFYIVRHGQTDWNVLKRIQGHTDIPLNDTGRQEVQNLFKEFKKIGFSVCYSSDLSRAKETADILIQGRPIKILYDKRLRERYFAHWEGLYFADYTKAAPSEIAQTETNEEMLKRTLDHLKETAEMHSSENVLTVTHGGVIRLLLNHLDKASELNGKVIGNTAVLKVAYFKGQFTFLDIQGLEARHHEWQKPLL